MHLEPMGTWWLLGICAGIVAGFLLYTHLSNFKQKVPLFYCWLGAIAVLGGAAAFFLPIAVNSGFNKDDDGSALRQALLYTTGGLLGVITLGETHRKNNQEKEKNENDHTRQVYAERRSRYTKAVEQLANEKAAVRLGGIYTLVGLVDEWLADDTLDPEERQKEGQVIINNLCSYIRSPFPLAEEIEEYEAYKALENLEKKEPEELREAESSRLQVLLKRFKNSDEYEEPKDITADYAKFHEEQDVRRAIFVEMSKRSNAFSKIEKGEVFKTTQGIWSDFDFDFSRAPVFYPLGNLTIEKGNFSSAKFYSNADFSRVKFTQNADFSWATFTQNADFSWATFTQNATFGEATFAQNADFRKATFTQNATFIEVSFMQNAYFSEANFMQNANFNEAAFTKNANFRKAIFAQKATFGKVAFDQNVTFKKATFKKQGPIFALGNYRARFSVRANPKNRSFATNLFIPLGKATLDGVECFIPVGTVLYDPDSWNKEKQYYRQSRPAKSATYSSNQEKT